MRQKDFLYVWLDASTKQFPGGNPEWRLRKLSAAHPQHSIAPLQPASCGFPVSPQLPPSIPKASTTTEHSTDCRYPVNHEGDKDDFV